MSSTLLLVTSILVLVYLYQDELLMRNSGHAEVGLETNNAALLEDVAQNADLYIANQDVSTQT